MNHFEVGLNPGLKEKMLIRHYTSYKDMYDTAVNVERAMKEKNKFYNKQQGIKRSKTSAGITVFTNHIRKFF